MALETDDYELWEKSFKRYGDHIISLYRALCSKEKLEKMEVNAERLFGFLKEYLQRRKQKHKEYKFGDDTELNLVIRKGLEEHISENLDDLMTVEKALQILRTNPKDQGAWATIAFGVYQPLVKYAASLLFTFKLPPGETVNDIVQEVILKVYQHWTNRDMNIASESELHAYLRVICRNLLIDRYRRERNAEHFVDFLSLNFEKAFQYESELYRSIFLNEIIEMMPPGCASLFRQYVTENLSLAEIADREGDSPAAFYSKWYRCIQKAKEIFQQKNLEEKKS